MRLEIKYSVLGALILGFLVGVVGYAAVNGDVSTPASQVAACFPSDTAFCGAGCIAA